MSEKKSDIQAAKIDQAMGVAPEEVDPGMSAMPDAGLMDVPTVIPELDSMLAAMSSALPAYHTTAWKNKPDTSTPIDAAAMTRIEQRLVDLTNAVNGLRDSVGHVRIAWIGDNTDNPIVTISHSGIGKGLRVEISKYYIALFINGKTVARWNPGS